MPRPATGALLRSYRVHTLLRRGSGLPLLFVLSLANVHDALFAQPLLALGCARSAGVPASSDWTPGTGVGA
jgi:hypothetical protein